MSEKQLAILCSMTAQDPIYQTLLAECVLLESEYLRIRDTLSPEDRCILERYISLCEELDHRKTCLAMRLSDTQPLTEAKRTYPEI